MKKFVMLSVLASVVLVNVFGLADDAATKSAPAPAGMVQPQYDADGKLLRPEGYRQWVFVGSSLGLDYSKPDPNDKGPGTFHHVYIQPEAYKHYAETGTFPEKTMLVMENYSAGDKQNNTAKDLTKDKESFENLNGNFSDQRTGVEVALKDTEKNPDGWGYFNFSSRAGLLPSAKPFPKQMCWDCHSQHAAVDNVFVQFYPVLREAHTPKAE